MGENLYRIVLSELDKVRIICQGPKCGAVVEVPIERIASKYPAPRCPLCGNDFDAQNKGENALVDFAKAVQALQAVQRAVQVEFVIPTGPGWSQGKP